MIETASLQALSLLEENRLNISEVSGAPMVNSSKGSLRSKKSWCEEKSAGLLTQQDGKENTSHVDWECSASQIQLPVEVKRQTAFSTPINSMPSVPEALLSKIPMAPSSSRIPKPPASIASVSSTPCNSTVFSTPRCSTWTSGRTPSGIPGMTPSKEGLMSGSVSSGTSLLRTTSKIPGSSSKPNEMASATPTGRLPANAGVVNKLQFSPYGNSSATQTPRSSSAMQTPRNSSAMQTPRNSSAMQTPRSSSTMQTPRNSSVVQTPRSSSIVQTPRSMYTRSLSSNSSSSFTCRSRSFITSPSTSLRAHPINLSTSTTSSSSTTPTSSASPPNRQRSVHMSARPSSCWTSTSQSYSSSALSARTRSTYASSSSPHSSGLVGEPAITVSFPTQQCSVDLSSSTYKSITLTRSHLASLATSSPDLQTLNLGRCCLADAGSELVQLQTLAPTLRHLDLSHIRLEGFSPLRTQILLSICSLTELRTLHLPHAKRLYEVASLQPLLKLSKLKSLGLSQREEPNQSLLSVVTNLSSLTALQLQHPHVSAHPDFLLQLSSLCHLRRLALGRCYSSGSHTPADAEHSAQSSAPKWLMAAAAMPSLTDLSLQVDDGLAMDVRQLRRLESLEVSSARPLDANSLIRQLPGLTALTRLSLDSPTAAPGSTAACATALSANEPPPNKVQDPAVGVGGPCTSSRLTLASLEMLCSLGARLRALELRGFGLLPEECMRKMMQLTALRHLDLRRTLPPASLDNYFWHCLLSRTSRLESLRVSGDASGLDLTLLSALPALQCVGLHDMRSELDLAAMSRISGLTQLDLTSETPRSMTPAELCALGSLASLKLLDLGGNVISGRVVDKHLLLPPSLKQCALSVPLCVSTKVVASLRDSYPKVDWWLHDSRAGRGK